jgi:hypothetical protein
MKQWRRDYLPGYSLHNFISTILVGLTENTMASSLVRNGDQEEAKFRFPSSYPLLPCTPAMRNVCLSSHPDGCACVRLTSTRCASWKSTMLTAQLRGICMTRQLSHTVHKKEHQLGWGIQTCVYMVCVCVCESSLGYSRVSVKVWNS